MSLTLKERTVDSFEQLTSYVERRGHINGRLYFIEEVVDEDYQAEAYVTGQYTQSESEIGLIYFEPTLDIKTEFKFPTIEITDLTNFALGAVKVFSRQQK